MQVEWLYHTLLWMYERRKLGVPSPRGDLVVSADVILQEKKLRKAKINTTHLSQFKGETGTKYTRIMSYCTDHPIVQVIIKPPPPSVYPLLTSQFQYQCVSQKLVCSSWYHYLKMIRKVGLTCYTGRMIRCCLAAEVEQVFPIAEVLINCQISGKIRVSPCNKKFITQTVPVADILNIQVVAPHLEILRRYGCILFNQNQTHVLLVQSKRGNWGFPKGKREFGETPKECALRELQEETGIQSHWFTTIENDPHHVVEMESLEDPCPSVGLFVGSLLSQHSEYLPKPEVSGEIQSCSWVENFQALSILPVHRQPLLEFTIQYILHKSIPT